MEDFQAMRAFSRVAELGSFTRAADELGLSRAMVSTHVHRLERRFGLKLLNRTTRKVALTPAGNDYLGHCRRVFAELAAAEETLRRSKEQPTGRLIVTANRDNATVRVDGEPAGFTPTVLTLTAGEHTLEVESRDVRPERRQVTVAADHETRAHVDLRYEPPPVRAASKTLLSVDEAPASITVLSQEELRSFVGAVRDGGPPRVGGEEGARALALAETILASIAARPLPHA